MPAKTWFANRDALRSGGCKVGQDYAEQRYYNGSQGRFFNPDPGGIATAVPSRPSSWNRYAYVEGDPVNSTDRHGLFLCSDCHDDDDDDEAIEGSCEYDPVFCVSPGPSYGYNPPSGQGGPGGGNLNAAAWAALGAMTWVLQPILKNEIQGLPDACYQAFAQLNNGNVTEQNMMTDANNVEFVDSAGPAGQLTMQGIMAGYGPVVGGAQTVQQYVQGQLNPAGQAPDTFTTAMDLTYNGQYTAIILLTPNFYNTPLIGEDPMLVLVHELLHYVSNQDDGQLVQNLNIPQIAGQSFSYDLSAWLGNGCGGSGGHE